jgi:hypothetical protein
MLPSPSVKVCFVIYFQETSNMMLILINGLGKTCQVGTECNKQQICNTNQKCAPCKEGFEPDDTQSKCEGMF